MQQRYLHFELIGRRLARALVIGIKLMTERGAFHVERTEDLVGLPDVPGAGKHVEESHQHVRRRAVGRIQHGNGEERAERDPVSVNEQNFFAGHFHKPP